MNFDDYDDIDGADDWVDRLTDHADMEDRHDLPSAQAPADDEPTAQVTLDSKQCAAIVNAADELFSDISGTAGVGKTFVARRIVEEVDGVALAATTGIASVNLGEGTTINSLLKFFDTKSLEQAYLDGYLQSTLNKLRRSGVQRILIDEKSMMDGRQLTVIARACREVNDGTIEALENIGVGENEDDYAPLPTRNSDLAPIGIVLVGDFGQLPPVPDEDQATGKKIPATFAFESKEWPLFAAHRVVLDRIYRQDAKDFINALHAIRRGHAMEALDFFTADRFSAQQDDQFVGTTIFAKNDAVERHNLLCMDKLPGKPLTYETTRNGKQRGDWELIPERLTLKEGALVMCLANRREKPDDDEPGAMIYANGDLGTLVGKSGLGWQVRLQRTDAVVTVVPVVRENTIPLEPGRRKALRAAAIAGTGDSLVDVITDNGKGKSEIIGRVIYMPLRAAYGCTVHKTQGLTIDSVQVNIRDPFFRLPSMLFVALSRARTAGGLRIVGDQRGFIERCKIEPRVQRWL